MKKIVELDLENVEITESGISDYYWPIAMNEIKRLTDLTKRELYAVVQETRDMDVDSYVLLEVMILGILDLVLQMAQATLLHVRSEKAGYQVRLTSNYRLLNMLQTGQVAGEHEFIKLLKSGPSPLKKIRLPLRFARDILKGFLEGVPRRRLLGINLKKDIVALCSHGLVRAWKRSSRKKVTFLRVNFWFKPVENLSVELETNDEKTIARLMVMVDSIFSSFQLSFPDVFRRYFESFVRDGFLYSKHHLQRVRRQNKVPMHLWGNTGGNIWMRLLSVMVREKGGEVTGFDHAGGCAFFENVDGYRLRELLVCDHFVTFSQKQSEVISKDCERMRTLYTRMPQLHYAEDLDFRKLYAKKQFNFPRTTKTIMYVSTVYPSEQVKADSHFMNDLMLLDWQARLFSQLKKMGYHIIFKPHPECAIQPPNSMKTLFGPIVRQGFFEDVAHEADLLLFDSLSSTTFRTAVLLDRPVVFIQFGLSDVRQAAESLLERRCSIVNGCFDANNRAELNWEDLQSGIEDALVLKDSSFENEYFVGC